MTDNVGMRKILVTGAAGFIGMHVSQALLQRGDTVIGLDNLNDYYDPQLKRDRVTSLQAGPDAGRFTFAEGDLVDMAGLNALFDAHDFDGVVHLAAQAGVRWSHGGLGIGAGNEGNALRVKGQPWQLAQRTMQQVGEPDPARLKGRVDGVCHEVQHVGGAAIDCR